MSSNVYSTEAGEEGGGKKCRKSSMFKSISDIVVYTIAAVVKLQKIAANTCS